MTTPNNINKGLKNIAQQKMMRGLSTDANMINNFGSQGVGMGRQALNNTLRGKNTQTNQTQSSSNQKNGQDMKNIVVPKKQNETSKTAKNIFGALGL